MQMSMDKDLAFIVHLDVDATNCDSLVFWDSIVDSIAKGI